MPAEFEAQRAGALEGQYVKKANVLEGINIEEEQKRKPLEGEDKLREISKRKLRD